VIGTRLRPGVDEPMHGDGFVYRCVSQPGAYGFTGEQWWACTPNGLGANLKRHKCTENADGTLTVEPSILVNEGKEESWHGYLCNGVWTECP
jgi:hypothetical protein